MLVRTPAAGARQLRDATAAGGRAARRQSPGHGPAGPDRRSCAWVRRAEPAEELPARRPAATGRLPDTDAVKVTLDLLDGHGEPAAWPAVPGPADGTEGLRHDGTVRLTPPADWSAQRPTAGPGGHAEPGTTVARGSPRHRSPTRSPAALLDRAAHRQHRRRGAAGPSARPAAVQRRPGAHRAHHPRAGGAGHQRRQPLPGRSRCANRPLYRRPDADDPVRRPGRAGRRRHPAGLETWTLVDDLPAGPRPVYRVDPVTGEVRFGDHDAQTGTRATARVPPARRPIRAARYRYVAAGAAGNVAAGPGDRPGHRADRRTPDRDHRRRQPRPGASTARTRSRSRRPCAGPRSNCGSGTGRSPSTTTSSSSARPARGDDLPLPAAAAARRRADRPVAAGRRRGSSAAINRAPGHRQRGRRPRPGPESRGRSPPRT